MEVLEIPVASIKITNRLRSTSEDKIAELAESIQQIGLLHPITVSKNGDGYLLLSGHHRLKSFLKLQREFIPATLHASDDLIQKLVECSENEIRQPLTELERSQHILLRENLLMQLGKRASTGENQWNRSGLTNEELGKSLHMTKRMYQYRKSVANNLHPEVQDILNETEYASNLMDLYSLSREGDDVQLEVAKLLSTGKSSTFKRALTLARCKCLPFNWNEEQSRIKELTGTPFSVTKFTGEDSGFARLCKLVSHDPDVQVKKHEWGTQSSPLASQHPDHSAHFINYYSKEGDIVADVMCGRGTTPLVAAALNRKVVAYDLSATNLKTIRSVALEHTPIKDSDLTLHHSCGVELKEYAGQENKWDMVLFDPPYLGAENYGNDDDPREVGLIKDLDEYNNKMETCLKNLKRLIKPSNWDTLEFHPIVIKLGSSRSGKNGITCLDVEMEVVARRLGLIVHDRIISVLNSHWAMFTVSRCIDHRYSVKNHETTLVLLKY